MQDTQVSYSPYFNRTRLVYFLHPTPAEIANLIDIFSSQGFLTNLAVSPESLDTLIKTKRPDAIIAYCGGGRGSKVIATVKTIGLSTRIYALTDKVADVAQVARIMRSGALFAFATPVRVAEVLRQVQSDLSQDIHIDKRGRAMVQGFNSLSQREREVLDLVVSGEKNRDIGQALGISPRTVEVHRGKLMTKLGANSVMDLARLVMNGEGTARRPARSRASKSG